MSATTVLNLLLIVWAAITGVFVVLMIWKSLLSMREEDVVYIDPAEASQAEEQRRLIAKVERLTSFAKSFGIASAILLLVSGGLWIYQGINASGLG
jgi:hypothetical protein